MTLYGPRQLFHELRRRRVFNTVALYVAGAWIALQVGEQAFPALDIPDRAIRYIWLGAFLLFPLVLVFGWRYDISKTGVSRTAAGDAGADADTSLKRPDTWFIGSLAMLALAVIASMLFEIGRVEPMDQVVVVPRENSIAVMPFGVCENRTNDMPLAGGLTGEVISRLAERDRLKVIGQATAFNLASVGSSTQEVSDLTKTQYVLTGTLCRDGMDLRLDAEMTDADGFIVWRESFTEVTNRFDQVEEQLARLVASGVARELGDVIQGEKDSPVNRLALEQLLIGKEYRRQGDDEQAREAFNQALEHQADMAEAVWQLAELELDEGGMDNVGSSIEKAWPLGQSALALALEEVDQGVPDFNAHWVAGQILHTLAILEEELIWRKTAELGEEEVVDRKRAAKRQFLEAEQHLRSALVLNPSASEVRALLSSNLQRQGVQRSGEALEIMEEGWNYDPFNSDFGYHLATQLARRGQYRQAMEVLNNFEALPNGKRPLYWTQLEIMNNYARFDDKLATVIEILETDPKGTRFTVIGHLWWLVEQIGVQLGLQEEALLLYDQVEKIPYPEHKWVIWARETFLVGSDLRVTGQAPDYTDEHLAEIDGMSNEEILDAWHTRSGQYVNPLWQSGQRERAIELMESLRHRQVSPIWSERQTSPTIMLAEMYIEVGRSEDAARLLAEAVAHLEEEYEAGIRHPGTLLSLSHVYGLQGNDDESLDMLERAIDYGSWAALQAIEGGETAEPVTLLLQRLEDDPRFVRSVNRMKALRDQQSANVRSLLTQYDMDALLVPVIEAVERRMKESAD